MTRTHDALHLSVLSTLAYFDQFDHPLTLLELRGLRFALPPEAFTSRSEVESAKGGGDGLPDEVSLPEILAATSLGGIGTEDGFYFLEGRVATVARRKRAYRLAEPKLRKATRAIRWMRLVPTVRMVAVCNSLAMSTAKPGSDIDLLIIARAGTLWITRFLIGGALMLTGQRPGEGDHADSVCISFFASDANLDLSSCALPGGDTYLAYWIATLVPSYDPDDLLPTLFERNRWLHAMVPAAVSKRPDSRLSVPAPSIRMTALLPLLRVLEPAVKRLQLWRFPASIKASMNRDTRVIVTDDMLKFHLNDRRAEYERGFRSRLASLGL